MTVQEFEASPAEAHNGLLLALWFDARGDWAQSHAIAQDVHNPDGAWVHAYLHRKEGDTWNAAYWYRQAHRPEAKGPLRAEWEAIVAELLTR